jgi:hypothetical protein
MANTLSTPVFTQKRPAVYGNENTSLLALAALHNGTTTPPAPKPKPTTQTPSQPQSGGVKVTKFQFRQLFTTIERIACDNAPSNVALPATARAAMVTLLKDLEVSGEVDLSLPQVITGVHFLATLGLITETRATQILANQAP